MCLVKNTEHEEKYNTISILKSLKQNWKTTLKYSVHFFSLYKIFENASPINWYKNIISGTLS